MKKLLFLAMAVGFTMAVKAQAIKGPESITYFQAPAEGVKFAKADVYLSHDKQLEQAKLEAQQEKNSAMGAKFGGLGEAVAGAANKGLSMLKRMENAVREFQDEKGRFAVWDFVPSYIIAKAETDAAVNVEIFVLNEPNPSPGVRMPTEPDKEGYYDVPYYVNVRYKITDPRGNLVLEENLGVLEGTQKTKNYTPPPAAAPGSVVVVEEDENDALSVAEEIGVNKAYNRVRKEVFSRYGFGQFDAPIKLGKIKQIKASKKLIKPTLEVFEGKEGLLLSKDDKFEVQKFVDAIEKDIDKCDDKTRWVAYHNLSVSYAWLEKPGKAKEYYNKYTEEIKETLDKMACWNKVLAGEMKAKEMREQVGTTFIGMKDQKKYREYNNVSSFVNYYPAGAKRYEKLFLTINRDLARFTDFYAHNDLLCQLFEIDYPFQFLPLNSFSGEPKGMEGQITKEGMEPVDFKVKFNRDKQIKELQAEQTMKDEDGNKHKIKTRDIKPQYNDEGEYTFIDTDAGSWQRQVSWNHNYYEGMGYIYDPLSQKTFGRAENITKDAGFMGGRTSDEAVRLRVNLDGDIFFKGTSNYFKMNAIFKDMLAANGLEYKRADTKTTFNTKANINEDGVLTQWSWDGEVETSFSGYFSSRTQEFNAEKMYREISFLEMDEFGNPKKLDYKFDMKGKLQVESKVSPKEYFSNYAKTNGAIVGEMSAESFNIKADEKWECSFKYDDQGNWIEMKVGPYTATRTFKY